MRVLALLGPNADVRDIAAFESAARTAIPAVQSIGPEAPPDAVLIFGGDGTVHRHLSSLVAAKAPTLVVPTGSGNDFARALGLANRSRALTTWRTFCAARTNVKTIDVAEITPEAEGSKALFCCVGGAGLDSEVNRRANHLPRWLRAHGGYALSVLPAAVAFHTPIISVDYEDERGACGRLSEPALMCAVANTSAYGHGMRVAPGARMDDGLLDLVFVRKTSVARLLTLFPTIYFGGHMRMREVAHRRVRRLRLSADPELDIYADGEFICRTPAEINVRRQEFRVIC